MPRLIRGGVAGEAGSVSRQSLGPANSKCPRAPLWTTPAGDLENPRPQPPLHGPQPPARLPTSANWPWCSRIWESRGRHTSRRSPQTPQPGGLRPGSVVAQLSPKGATRTCLSPPRQAPLAPPGQLIVDGGFRSRDFPGFRRTAVREVDAPEPHGAEVLDVPSPRRSAATGVARWPRAESKSGPMRSRGRGTMIVELLPLAPISTNVCR